MPQHYPKSVTETAIFCGRCMKLTPWRVADGRRQWCIPCYEQRRIKSETENAAAAAKKELRGAQGSLFQ